MNINETDRIIDEFSVNHAQELRDDFKKVLEKHGVKIEYDESIECHNIVYKGVVVDRFEIFEKDFLNWTPFSN